MADLSPDLTAKLGRLLPRLASDAPGEVNATVQALRRTLDRAGLDLHDLAARLTAPPRPVLPGSEGPASPGDADLLNKAAWLQDNALDRLTPRQADFLQTAWRPLAARRRLTPKQADWLDGLYAQHREAAR